MMNQRRIIECSLILFFISSMACYNAPKIQSMPIKTSQVEVQRLKVSEDSVYSKIVKISGEVAKGQHFEKEIGNNLFFRLYPVKYGWLICVGTKTSKERGTNNDGSAYEHFNDFASVVTPPHYGINDLIINGWHLRNIDNTGPNGPGVNGVNAPQEIREFNFVLSDEDYLRAEKALKIALRRIPPEEKIYESYSILENISKGHGILTMRDLKFDNLTRGELTGIDFMKFDVELSFP